MLHVTESFLVHLLIPNDIPSLKAQLPLILRGKAFSAISNLEGLPVEAPAELLVARPGDQVETGGWCLTGAQVDVVDAEH